MPLKAPPKVYQLLIKTHKLTILLTVPPTTSVATLKAEVLSALTSNVNEVENVPRVTSENDFEISKAIKERGKTTVRYEVLETSQTVKSILTNWEALFLQFRDSSDNLMSVNVTQPSLLDEDDEPRPRPIPSLGESLPTNKGKRKAPPE